MGDNFLDRQYKHQYRYIIYPQRFYSTFVYPPQISLLSSGAFEFHKGIIAPKIKK